MRERKIYLIENLIDGKRYVGQTTRRLQVRWQSHVYKSMETNSRFSRAIRESGKDNFSIQLLSIATDKAHGDQLEKYFVQKFRTYDPLFGYNSTEDGGGNKIGFPGFRGRKHTEESRRKMSASRIGNTNHTGKKASEETRRKMSIAHLGNQNARKGARH